MPTGASVRSRDVRPREASLSDPITDAPAPEAPEAPEPVVLEPDAPESGVPDDSPRHAAVEAAHAAVDKSALDVVVLDVGDLLGVTDHFVVASARSDRQLRTVVDAVEARLRGADRRPRRREGTPDSGWVLLDYGDVVVHVQSVEHREFYALDRLWADAPATRFADPARVAGSVGDA